MGCPVAVKRLNTNGRDLDSIFKVPLIHLTRITTAQRSAFTQHLCREIIGWKHLSHPNILPLKAVSISIDPPRFCILSEWMPNGNVMEYARSNPEANRLQLVTHLFFPQNFSLFIHQ